MNVPKAKKAFCKQCKNDGGRPGKHTVHKVTQYKTGKASLYAQGKRRYDRKQSGYGGQVRRGYLSRRYPPYERILAPYSRCAVGNRGFQSCDGRTPTPPPRFPLWIADQARVPQEGEDHQEDRAPSHVHRVQGPGPQAHQGEELALLGEWHGPSRALLGASAPWAGLWGPRSSHVDITAA